MRPAGPPPTMAMRGGDGVDIVEESLDEMRGEMDRSALGTDAAKRDAIVTVLLVRYLYRKRDEKKRRN